MLSATTIREDSIVMQDEYLLWRDPAPGPYVPIGSVLRLPPTAISATRELLQREGRRESCVFWYGERDGDTALVRSVRAPTQRSMPGNYHVEPDAISEMVRDLPEGWKPLAQIHSHPGMGTEHSRYDDRMISSRRILSIVFPIYGVPAAPWPQGIGVHEWQNDYWHMLSPGQVHGRLEVIAAPAVDRRDFR
ncbi:Mov34/MPN/PAD-1 family protein [Mesorhizobium sp. LNJC394B00]|uniref:Mov34/MPN/PAD-1 family protein n=2 Tax=Phyllobacteriaceae TaxID=69277 RepID=UPI0012EB8868|nr:Mov34/MPN/PAD-1 family protein [Mesorhizobium sp. LNJC394B00]